MANYHVGCGLAGIYAGILKPNGDEWKAKSCVTTEAIDAVIGHMYWQIPDGENSIAYAARLRDGKWVRLKLEVADECPEWAKEAFKEEKDGEEA